MSSRVITWDEQNNYINSWSVCVSMCPCGFCVVFICFYNLFILFESQTYLTKSNLLV